jgi:hypothetical protein
MDGMMRHPDAVGMGEVVDFRAGERVQKFGGH